MFFETRLEITYKHHVVKMEMVVIEATRSLKRNLCRDQDHVAARCRRVGTGGVPSTVSMKMPWKRAFPFPIAAHKNLLHASHDASEISMSEANLLTTTAYFRTSAGDR